MRIHNPQITGSLTLSGSTTFSAGTIEFTGANQKISGSASSTGSFGSLIVTDGTVPAPSITNAGDTDTGLYFGAANEINIALKIINKVCEGYKK